MKNSNITQIFTAKFNWTSNEEMDQMQEVGNRRKDLFGRLYIVYKRISREVFTHRGVTITGDGAVKTGQIRNGIV